MQMRHVVGYVLIPAALLLGAWAARSLCLWGLVMNWTFPWFCSAFATALLIVGATSLLTGCAPADIPALAVWLVYVGVTGVLCAGVLVDGMALDAGDQIVTGMAEWAGFAVILLILFMAPRIRSRKTRT